MLGKSDYDLMPAYMADSYGERDRQVYVEKGPIVFEEEGATLRGEVLTITTRKVPLQDANGTWWGWWAWL